MRIFLNDDAHDVEPGTLAAALEALGFAGRKIATAVNGRFVAAAARPRTALADGDRIEVVAPMQGG
jgi:sulfur carrier protein